MQDTSVRTIGSRLEPFLDDWLLDRLDGATLRMHSPQPAEIFAFDRPWEGDVSFYVTMLEHEGEYRMYYRGWKAEGAPATQAVALSKDGIHWERPNLGLFEWEGSHDNNIILTGQVAEDGFVPFYDRNPAVPPSERWKAVGVELLPDRTPVLMPYVSNDGFRWRRWRDTPIITDGAFDSQNLAYWDDYRKHYVAFYRDFIDINQTGKRYRGIRSVKWATSDDFEHWTPGQWFDYGNTPLEQLYTNAATPCPRAPHIYLSFPKRFVPERKAILQHSDPGVSDAVFMTSRDGLHWDRRFMEAFIRPGRDWENWTERNIGVAFGVLQTAADELSVYWVEHYRHPTCRLRRGTVRLDGFASLYAGYYGGEAVTKPLVFEVRELMLNYETSAAGSVRVEIQDAEGHALSGYALADCPEMYGDQIEQAVQWASGSDVSHLAGQPVRLRFALKDADVYSLRFRT
ncbi:MAG: hypothetical protein AUK03_03295 [Anaerolineae bacterium CG2_30_64_16]|nr:MAG: hypothetical protein AUK03_03295 [Anaerolineae bacterium CG2_30_64_16]